MNTIRRHSCGQTWKRSWSQERKVRLMRDRWAVHPMRTSAKMGRSNPHLQLLNNRHQAHTYLRAIQTRFLQVLQIDNCYNILTCFHKRDKDTLKVISALFLTPKVKLKERQTVKQSTAIDNLLDSLYCRVYTSTLEPSTLKQVSSYRSTLCRCPCAP